MESSTTTDPAPAKRSRKFTVVILGLVGLSLLTLICLGVGLYVMYDRVEQNFETVSQAVAKLADQPVLNQIAFVGNDRNLWLVSPDGKELRHITTDGKGYHFPTWAPDSRRLAFIGPNNQGEAALYIASASRSAPMIVFDQTESAPFYLYWSPNSSTLTFLTQESGDLSMRQIDADTPGSDRVLGAGAPFYWVWSPTGEKLLMHVGGSRALSPDAHISLLENRVDAESVELDLVPGKFQAPLWSADGKYFYYSALAEGHQEAIFRTEVDTMKRSLITKLRSFVYLTVSPDNQHLAYVQIERHHQPPFGAAYIVDTDGANHRKLMDNPVGSLYWSPDGTKLAVLTLARRDDGSTAKAAGLAAPLPQEILFRWLIYSVATEEFETLISFNPTVEFLQIVPYFDQYHLSLTFWSPDSRYFVVTEEEANNIGEGTVWVLDTTGQEEPLKVGEGTLAVWSWQ